MSKTPTLTAWHYTTGDKFDGIKFTGEIMPATAGVPENERPVVWFSIHPYFEQTAVKAIMDPATGAIRDATLAEMMEMTGGLVRLGVAPRLLLTGEALQRKARISSTEWRKLRSAALEMGADPAHWFGTVENVPLSVCKVQRMDPATMQWGDVAA